MDAYEDNSVAWQARREALESRRRDLVADLDALEAEWLRARGASARTVERRIVSAKEALEVLDGELRALDTICGWE